MLGDFREQAMLETSHGEPALNYAASGYLGASENANNVFDNEFPSENSSEKLSSSSLYSML